MQFQGALIREQGQSFAIVLVKPHVLASSSEASDTQSAFEPAFPSIPLVLAAQTSGGMRYYGRPDIVRFLASISAARIPWRTYSLGT